VARALDVPARLAAVAPAGLGRNAETLLASDRILASICESIIGAAYVAFGYERVAPAVVEAFAGAVAEAVERPVDFKSVLQERLAQRGEAVSYRVEAEAGPAHHRHFVVLAEVSGSPVGRGEGATKKQAEQEAALHALEGLDAGAAR
jgi:ribonuclease-3